VPIALLPLDFPCLEPNIYWPRLCQRARVLRDCDAPNWKKSDGISRAQLIENPMRTGPKNTWFI
jgi:hypothetical protein